MRGLFLQWSALKKEPCYDKAVVIATCWHCPSKSPLPHRPLPVTPGIRNLHPPNIPQPLRFAERELQQSVFELLRVHSSLNKVDFGRRTLGQCALQQCSEKAVIIGACWHRRNDMPLPTQLSGTTLACQNGLQGCPCRGGRVMSSRVDSGQELCAGTTHACTSIVSVNCRLTQCTLAISSEDIIDACMAYNQ